MPAIRPIPRTQPTLPPVPLGRSGTRYAQALNKLGWHWWPSDIAVATTEYDGRAKCINLGQCTLGCAQGAKASVDITYWPHALRARVELRTRCRVREITTNEQGLASGVVYYDPNGVERFQPAEVVILAANGVGTPRLLLNSASSRFPDGLANSSGLVGKNLMLHPWPQVSGYVDGGDGRRPRAADCAVEQGVLRDRPVARLRAGLYAAVRPRQRSRPRGDHQPGHRPPALGQGSSPRLSHAALPPPAWRSAVCEDLPEEHNRVTLDPVLKDSHGIPAPRIDYTVGENTKAMMEHGIARATEVLEAAGATNIFSSAVLSSPGHLLGTARMGTDPERSVVNEWGRCHDVKNLFIVDGSIWVTSGGVNPTSTIQALALYIADSIKQRLATLFD